MKKLNSNRLSEKKVRSLKLKAAFSNFVKSLKQSNAEIQSPEWKCCGTMFSSLQDIHKHVSTHHLDDVKGYLKNLNFDNKEESSGSLRSSPSFLNETLQFICHCLTKTYVVILFYHYVEIPYDLYALQKWQKTVCHKCNLKGKIRLSCEGINGTVEGCPCAIETYKANLAQTELFRNISTNDFKHSTGTGQSFDDLSVSVCDELCTLGITPKQLSFADKGIDLSPNEFHTALAERKMLLIQGNDKNVPILLDCRNFYESRIGYFEDATKPDLRKFSYFPDYVDENKKMFEGRDVLTYCTGGIRCERATAYIKSKTNCSNVYQLQGGIHKYLENYPNGFFKGRLFVFDKRYSIGPSTSEVTSSCFFCSNPHDIYEMCAWEACRQLVLICPACRNVGKTNCCNACEFNAKHDIRTEQCDCTAKRRVPTQTV